MLSVAVVKPDQVELVDIPVPTPGPYEARIRSEAACLCNATDRKLIEGHFPGVEDYPLILGHETVGIVDRVGENVRNFKVGDRVIGGLLLNTTNPAFASGWGGFSEYILAGDHHAMVADGVVNPENGWYEVYEIMRVVPASISVEDAVLLCTWREVYGAFGDFQFREDDDILVFGAGPVGLSFVKFARLLNLGFIAVVEILPEKRRKAIEMGADTALAPDEEELRALVDQRGKPFDAVIDAVGKEAIINSALPLIKMGGAVCVYGVIDTPMVNLHKDIGPYNFNLFVHQWPTRSREAAAQEPLCEWIESGKLSHKEFISIEYPITQIIQAIEHSKTGQTIKTLLRF
ncbi:MAG: zinc-binding dehydrogenase [Anaerolineales bacterium]|nr:zinc-binding dehydrogenase [Anaerolineales bacterium]